MSLKIGLQISPEVKCKEKNEKKKQHPRTEGNFKMYYVYHQNNRGRKRTNKSENIFEVILTKTFPTLMTDTNPQIQIAQRTRSRINTTTIHEHVIFKLQQTKTKKILKEVGRENTSLQKNNYYIDISSKSLKQE